MVVLLNIFYFDSAESDAACFAPGLQEEADTQLLPHVADAVQKDCEHLTIHRLAPDELCVASNDAASFRHIPAQEILASLDSTKCLTLPLSLVFSGCDTMSVFADRKRKQIGRL